MAGRGDIEAGRAHVKLYVDNSGFNKWAGQFPGQLRSAGKLLMGLGTVTAGVGSAVVGAIGGAVQQFASMGTELSQASQRTGVATDNLAEMKYAAESVGGSLGDVESALSAMRGKYLDPAQFDEYAAAVAAIENPTLRAARAQEIFGSAGTKLLPVLGQMGKLRQEARDLGLVPTQEAVQDAAEIGKAFKSLSSAALASLFEIGAAVAPLLKPGLEMLKNIAGTVNRWIRDNAALVRAVAMLAVGLVAAGAGVAAIGGVLFALGSAGTIAATVVGAISAAFAFMASPLGVVIGLVLAIGAGVYSWMRHTESGRAAFAALVDFAMPLLETLRETVGGVFDALKAGDIQLAAQIALKGLQILFFEVFASISETIGGQLGDTLGAIGKKMLGGDFAGAFQTALKQMLAWGASFAEGIVAIFTLAARKATDAWKASVTGIATGLLDASAQGGAMGKIASFIIGADMQAMDAERKRLDEALGQQGGESATEEAKRAAREQIGGMAASFTGLLDDIDAKMQGLSDEAAADLDADAGGGSSKLRDEVQRLKDELAALGSEAAAAAAGAEARAKGAGKSDVVGGVEMAARTASTFSAAGAVMLGQGAQSPIERAIERADAKQAKRDGELLTAAKDLKFAFGMGE